MAQNDTELESLLEELTKTQITEQDVEEQVVSLVLDKDPEELNALPLLHRLELKRLLKEHDEHDLAAQIEE